MTEHFPKEFDARQHELLRQLYGHLVPPLDALRVRAGLHAVVDQMFAKLGRLPRRRDIRVMSVETRNAAFLKVTMTGSAVGAEGIIADAVDAARHTCEHCGKLARSVFKIGLEASAWAPDLDLGDRLLCSTCTDEFRLETGL